MFYIDYFYYRIYKRNLKGWGGGHSTALFCGTCFAGLLSMLISMGLWTNLIWLLFGNAKIFVYIVPLFYFFPLWKRYKRINSELLHKYKRAKLNRLLPDVCIPIVCLLYFWIGIELMIPIQKYLKSHFEQGEWGDYLLSLFTIN